MWQLLCCASEADKKQYADFIKSTSACEKVIRRDIARTYPEHDFFKEKDGLGQVNFYDMYIVKANTIIVISLVACICSLFAEYFKQTIMCINYTNSEV